MTRNLTIWCVVGLSWLAATPGSAQTLTIQGSATKASGPDFASNVIGDPWDFNQASDYSYMFSEDAAGAGLSGWPR